MSSFALVTKSLEAGLVLIGLFSVMLGMMGAVMKISVPPWGITELLTTVFPRLRRRMRQTRTASLRTDQ